MSQITVLFHYVMLCQAISENFARLNRNNLRHDQEAHLSVFKMHTFKNVCFVVKTDVAPVTCICYPALPTLS